MIVMIIILRDFFQSEYERDLEFEFVSGKQINSQLLYTTNDKHLYKRNRKLVSGHMAYICRKPGCNSRIYFDSEGYRVYYRPKEFIPHNHGTQEKDKFNFEIERELKDEIINPDTIVKNKGQTSVVRHIFDSKMQEYVSSLIIIFGYFHINLVENLFQVSKL